MLEQTTKSRMLLVDDDPMLLRVLADLLGRRLPHVSIETADSSLDSLQKISSCEFDVVVTDLLMGGLSGLELLDHVRIRWPRTMVILITGADDRDFSVRALRGGAYDFITKPVDAEYLAISVLRALETRCLRSEVERQQEALRRHAQELEETVRDRTEELRRANRMKDEFLATISHELRTPLTAVLGWARLLSGGRLDQTTGKQAIEAIERNARSQAQLIDDMLDVSRIITGKLRLDIQPVDLPAVLDAAIEVILPAANAKEIAIEPVLERLQVPLRGDPERIQQVLWNLLSNAVKFTPRGGRVTIRTAQKSAHVEIEVSDNGPGIDPDFLPFVLERFRQNDQSFASRRGLGLGLAIVRHLVELHGGSVSASSEGLGRGASFLVTLPCSVRESDAKQTRGKRHVSQNLFRRASSECLSGVRILVIEDESDTRDVLRLTFELSGAKVFLACSTRTALEAFQRERPDVLLCDLGLGKDDGCALLRKIRALPKEQGGVVLAIALTGYAKPEDRTRALYAGFELHLPKPGPSNLPEIVAGLLEEQT